MVSSSKTSNSSWYDGPDGGVIWDGINTLDCVTGRRITLDGIAMAAACAIAGLMAQKRTTSRPKNTSSAGRKNITKIIEYFLQYQKITAAPKGAAVTCNKLKLINFILESFKSL